MKRQSTTRWTAALIAAATLAVSRSAAPPRPTEPSAAAAARSEAGATNGILANAVYSELNADPIYYFRHVDVRVDNGVAHLSGYDHGCDLPGPHDRGQSTGDHRRHDESVTARAQRPRHGYGQIA